MGVSFQGEFCTFRTLGDALLQAGSGLVESILHKTDVVEGAQKVTAGSFGIDVDDPFPGLSPDDQIGPAESFADRHEFRLDAPQFFLLLRGEDEEDHRGGDQNQKRRGGEERRKPVASNPARTSRHPARRPRFHRSACDQPGEIIGKLGRRLVSSRRNLVHGCQDHGLQVARDRGIDAPRRFGFGLDDSKKKPVAWSPLRRVPVP